MRPVCATILIAAVFCTLACGDSHESDEQRDERNAPRLRALQLLEELGASPNWFSLFATRDSLVQTPNILFWQPFSYEIGDVIQQQGNKPIFFLVQLVDIERNDSGFTAVFSNTFGFRTDEPGNFNGWLRLNCSREQAEHLSLIDKRRSWTFFAVFAVINGFSKPHFGVEVAVNEEYPEESELYIDAVRTYVLEGSMMECVNMETWVTGL